MATIILKLDELKNFERNTIKRSLGIKNKDKVNEVILKTLPSSTTKRVEVTKDSITGKLNMEPADSNITLYSAEWTILDKDKNTELESRAKVIPEMVFNIVKSFNYGDGIK